MRSSYIENNFGEVLRQNVLGFRPRTLVELGVLDGYSALHIGLGIKDMHRLYDLPARLEAYDLFEDYPFTHGDQQQVVDMLQEAGVADYVQVIKGNAYEVCAHYPDQSIEFLHIDLSNDGKVIRDIVELWHPKIALRGVVAIEGGSEERDNVEWMIKYNKPSLRLELRRNPILSAHYFGGTYYLFPSLTVLIRKWWE